MLRRRRREGRWACDGSEVSSCIQGERKSEGSLVAYFIHVVIIAGEQLSRYVDHVELKRTQMRQVQQNRVSVLRLSPNFE